MKLAIGSIQIECNTEEFLELYPKLMNGHAVNITKTQPRDHKGSSAYEPIMNYLDQHKHELNEWTLKDLSRLTGYSNIACVNAMKKAIKERKVKSRKAQKGKLIFSFLHGYQETIFKVMRGIQKEWTLENLSIETGYTIDTCKQVLEQAIAEGKVTRTDSKHYALIDNGKFNVSSKDHRLHAENTTEQEPYTMSGRNCVGMSEDFFNQMLEHAKPLIVNGGCSQSQIMKQFRNLPASVVEYFLSKAIQVGIIKEQMGTFSLAMQKVQTEM